MKRFLTLNLLLLFGLMACRKETSQTSDTFLQKVQAGLKDSVANLDFESLDFKRAVLSKVDSIGLYFLRIPFKGKKIQNEFVIVKTTRSGQVQTGKIVHIEGCLIDTGQGKVKRKIFDGAISISSLDRKTILNSNIYGGYIEALHPKTSNLRTEVVPEEDVLPEVVVVAYVRDYSYSYSYWFMVQSFFYDSYNFGGVGGGYYYESSDGSGGYYDGSGLSSEYAGAPGSFDPYDNVQQESVILVDYENQADNPAVEIEKYLACFEAIPNEGATASIEIFVDIPVDSDPNKIFDIGTLSPGHVFINITKKNGTQSVSQNFGWYPKAKLQPSLTTAPVDGKFVDNGGHEFNASLRMNLSPADLQRTLNEIRYLAGFIKYDIDEYNCTDFALDVFNASRVDKLEIPLYNIPGGMTSAGSRTPNGLYNKLKEMKMANHPESGNILTNIIKGWAGSSTGPCN